MRIDELGRMNRKQISHHTGATMIALFRQTMEFTNSMRQAVAVQSIWTNFPALHAGHGRDTRARIKPKEAKIG